MTVLGRRYRLRGRWNERPRHLTASSEHHFETGYGPSETIGSAVVARPSGNPKGRPIGSQKQCCAVTDEKRLCAVVEISETGGPPFEWKVRTNGRPNDKRDCRIRDPCALVGPVIPNCGDIDSSAPPSAPEQAAHIPLDYRTFLQWMSQWRRT